MAGLTKTLEVIPVPHISAVANLYDVINQLGYCGSAILRAFLTEGMLLSISL